MRRTRERDPAAPTVVQVTGRTADDLADYARHKIDTVLGRTRKPVLHSRLHVVRHDDPARGNPVVANACCTRCVR